MTARRFAGSIVALAVLFAASLAHAAPIQILGFETGDTSECRSIASAPTVSGGAARSGSYGLDASSAGSGTTTPNCRVGIPGTTGLPTAEISQATTYSRFYFNVQTLPASAEEEFVTLVDTAGAAKAQYRITSSGTIKACDSTSTCGSAGSTTLSTSTWYRIEIQTTTGAGSTAYEIRINGTTELSGTMSQGSTNVGSLRLGKVTNRNSQQIRYFFDDVSIGTATWPGEGAILRMGPDSNGSTAQWTAGTGSSNFAEVDEVPTDGDTTYIQKAAASSQAHLVGLDSTTTAGISGTINCVKAYQSCRESVSVTSATLIRIRSGGTNSDSSKLNGSTSFQSQFRVLATDPADSAAWTTTDLDSVEIGASDTAATASVRCSTMALYVDFTAATPTPTPTATPTATATPTNTPTPTPTPTAGGAVLRLLASSGVGQ